MTRSAGRERLARLGLAPRCLDRLEAAAYVGVGETTFDVMVGKGSMPPARKAEGRLVWDRLELDRAIDALPHAIESAPRADGKPAKPGTVWGQARA